MLVEQVVSSLRDIWSQVTPTYFAAGVLLLGIIYAIINRDRPYAGLPVVKLDHKGIRAWLPSQLDFMLNPNAVLARGERDCPSAFQVMAGSGYKVIVPNRFAEELRSHPLLEFNDAVARDFFVDYPGYEGMRTGLGNHSGIIQDIVRVKLTRRLAAVTQDLVEETSDSLEDAFGDTKEWKSTVIRQDIVDLVSRMSARVFLGAELAHNKDWLKISQEYAVDCFKGQVIMHMVPNLIRPVFHWFLPVMYRLRNNVANARRIIGPEIAKHQKAAMEAEKSGKNLEKSENAIWWMLDIANGRDFDFAAGQLNLSFAAIHTTSDTAAKAILQLCETPEFVQPLREEIISVLKEDGWAKTTFAKMKLLDSFMKEVQRTRKLLQVNMQRLTRDDLELSDGTVIPKGAIIMVRDDASNDPNIYPEPEKFIASRYADMRKKPGEENRHQFATTSADNIAFGHGEHACPGRFFAGNEIKVALCFLLMRYDFRLAPGTSIPPNFCFEHNVVTPPEFEIQYRRRREEIDLLQPKLEVA